MRHLFDAGARLSFFRLRRHTPDALAARESRIRPSGRILYYKVAHLHPIYEALTANGVKFEQKPALVAPMPDHDLWMAFFRDSENNPLALMVEVRKAA